MSLLGFLKQLFAGPSPSGDLRGRSHGRAKVEAPEAAGHLGADELAVRLGVPLDQLLVAPVGYQQFAIAKRGGGQRRIAAPIASLKALQRTILRRLLARLRSHPAATGFERTHSIVTNAAAHSAAAVAIRMDLREFFTNTSAARVDGFFRGIGRDAPAAELLTRLCTHEGALPQGAPTSPRLSNLVNVVMDVRLAGLAASLGAVYTRYADDMTFSLNEDNHTAVATLIRCTKQIVADFGYKLHPGRKLRIRRRHQSQRVTGLVVNERPALPRETRRMLRAAAHHLATGRAATLTEEQLQGWDALQHMIETQRPDVR